MAFSVTFNIMDGEVGITTLPTKLVRRLEDPHLEDINKWRDLMSVTNP